MPQTFEQYQASHLERQTRAIEAQARDVSTIKLILQVFFWVTVVGVLLVLIQIADANR
ncbi:hypothetical protein [Klenkia terrae]|uniref:Uncharacterized protein n=1 Tax=Klenkia terrae TaxID=1052259 RepID=A0ABU8E277_9ACTN|nr:hypothetical protein [Klenkia terrae]